MQVRLLPGALTDQVVEQADTQVSEACAERREGSSPSLVTAAVAANIPGYGLPAQSAKLGRPGSIPGGDTLRCWPTWLQGGATPS